MTESEASPPLPAWAAVIRPAQVEAVETILRRFEQGVSIVALDAPTGAGKTLIAELVRRALGVHGLYVCLDRGLQDQVEHDFPYARVIKGRRNYPTRDRPEAFPDVSCDDCTSSIEGRRCDWCTPIVECPYKIAKWAARAAPLAVANTAYLLAEANSVGEFSRYPFIVADEADRLESALMAHVEVLVSAVRLSRLGLTSPDLDEAPSVVLAQWVDDKLLPALGRELTGLVDRERHGNLDHRGRRQLRGLRRLIEKLEIVPDGLVEGTWVAVKAPRRQDDEDDGTIPSAAQGVVFKPVRVDQYAGDLLWKHGKKWLLMSATVLNAAGLFRDLGVVTGWAVVRVPSDFPPERRPIYQLSVTSVTAKTEDLAVPHLVQTIEALLREHKEDRVLVHTVSYRLMGKLRNSPLGDDPRALWYEGADTFQDLLQRYRSREAAVLFAPALERGLDLPDDECRAVVVVKVPYPNLGDRQVAARMQQPGGQEWYRDATLRSLVQMTGRGMRHAEDRCTCYVLDTQFDALYSRYANLFPAWWRAALVDFRQAIMRA